MRSPLPTTMPIRLAALRKLVSEPRNNGMLSAEEATSLTEVPNVPNQGNPPWNSPLKSRQVSSLSFPTVHPKGRRDYAIVALLVGCALRRGELALLTLEDIANARERLGHC